MGAVASVDAGDFNSDGFMDLALMNRVPGGISLLFNNGDGTFTTTGPIGGNVVLSSLCIDDVNADGFLDLIGSGEAIGTSSRVLLGTGTGVFRSPLHFGDFGSPDMMTADFDGDGTVDVAYLRPSTNGVRVMPGNGDGTFRDGETLYTGQNPRRLVVNDLNRDGYPDLAVCNAGNNTASVLLNAGDGTFAPAANSTVSIAPIDIAAGDLNGDGIPDLALVFSTNSGAQLLMGVGDGSFAPPFYLPSSRPIGGSLRVAIEDMNSDGMLDLVITLAQGGLDVMLGHADGTFDPANYIAGTSYSAIAIADLDGNAFLDLALANADPANGGAQVVMGTGYSFIDIAQHPLNQHIAPNQNAAFSVLAGSTTGLPISYQWRRNGVPIADGGHFSGAETSTLTVTSATTFEAGEFDVVMTGCPGEPITTSAPAVLSIATPLPPLSCQASFASAASHDLGSNLTYAAVSDMNADGTADLVATNYADQTVSIATGSGDGSFGTPISYNLGGGPWGVAVGDLNGDNAPDLAIANHTVSRAAIMLCNTNGDVVATAQFPTGNGPISIVLGDFNADGKQDLATANYYDDNVSVLLGVGDGSFLPATNFAAGATPMAIATGDLNSDNLLDLVVANSGTNTVSILIGARDGAFLPSTNLPVGQAPASVVVGDVNNDGRLDIVTADFQDHAVSVLLGNGSGVFAGALRYPSGVNPRHVTLGDMNSDNRSDLIVSNYNANDISVMLGHGDGTFATATNWPAGANPIATAIADFDADGKPDLAVANFNASVSVLLNNGPSMGFSHQPISQSVMPGGAATFTVAVSGQGPFNYQWRHNGTPVSGATSSTLTISNAMPSNAGSYDVQIRGGCNPAAVSTSNAAVLTVGVQASSCIADANRDGIVNSQDFFDFLTVFFAGCP